MPIRLRVTLLATWLLSVALAIFGLIFYLVLVDSLRSEVDRRLESRAQEVEAGAPADLLGAMLATQPDPQPPVATLPPSAFDVLEAPGLVTQVLDRIGEPIATQGLVPGTFLPVDQGQARRSLAGEARFFDVRLREGVTIRVLYRPLRINGQIQGVIEVAESLAPLEATATGVQRYLLATGGVTLGLAALVSWVVVGRALEPISAITRTTRQIRATGELGRRVPAGATRDEVGQLAETINDMLGSIERTVSVQREFLADSSHELRSPLTVIRGNLDLLRRAPDEESRAECVSEAESEARRMAKIVDDLLLLARQDAAQTMERRPVDLGDLIRQVERAGRVVADGVAIEVGRAEPLVVEGDPERLRQAVGNLVQNALRHTAPGGRVTLDVRRADGGARVVVADTGSGIAPEHLPRIFDRFYRVDKERSRASGGSGLGLAIVRHVAEAHGGSVSVESEVGKGSTFAITLPLAQSAAEAPTGAS